MELLQRQILYLRYYISIQLAPVLSPSVTVPISHSFPAKVIKQHPCRIPLALQAKVDQLVKEMLKQEVVNPSKSPWSSPAVLVTKKTETHDCASTINTSTR